MSTVRDMDMFAVPVSLSYKGKSHFNTLCGGCFTLVLVLTFLSYSVISLHDLITNPVLKGNAQTSYFSSADNTDIYNITTTNSTLAVAISNLYTADENTNKLVRVVFKRITPFGLQFIPTVNCSDFFAGEINEDTKDFFEYAIDPTLGQWVSQRPEILTLEFARIRHISTCSTSPIKYSQWFSLARLRRMRVTRRLTPALMTIAA